MQKFAEANGLSLERAKEICEHNAEYYTQLYGYPYDPETVARMELEGGF